MGRHPAFDVVSDSAEVGRDLAARRFVPPVLAFLPRRSLPEFVDDRGERRQDLGKRRVSWRPRHVRAADSMSGSRAMNKRPTRLPY
jgi:hypothetical protein